MTSEQRIVELEQQVADLHASLALHLQLLPLITATCGRGNCNCVGSRHIKQLIDQAGLSAPTTGNR